jgi:flagellar basal body-associated protein FliL
MSNNHGTVSLFRFTGYGLLLLALSNFVNALFPAYFTNETWVFQTLGNLVGSVPIPILGLVMVFYGESKARTGLGTVSLKFVSWLSLVLAVFFLAIAFAGLSVTFRINNNNNIEANSQLSRQLAQAQEATTRLKNSSDSDLVKAAVTIQAQNSAIKLDLNNPQVLRQQFETEINNKVALGKVEIETARQSAFYKLLKQSIKWNFEALLSAGLFWGIWRITSWARISSKQRYAPESELSQTSPNLDDLIGLRYPKSPELSPTTDILSAPKNIDLTERKSETTNDTKIKFQTQDDDKI